MNVKRISVAQYEAMTDAWAKSGKLSDVATAGNVSTDIAKKVLNAGHDDYPPIRERVERLRTIHMREEDQRREEETRVARAATRKILHDGVKATREMKLVPKGTRVKQSDGTYELECDERTYQTVLNVIDKAVTLRDVLDGKHDRPVVGVGVQVNVNDNSEEHAQYEVTPVPQASPEDTRRQAEEFMRAYMPALEQTYGQSHAASEILSALTEAARVRI